MDALEILAEAREAGVSLHVEGEGIRVEPRSALSPELRAMIIAEKPAILAVLRASGRRYWRFRVTPEGATPFEVRTLPEATLTEARELWPGAMVEALPALPPVDNERHERPVAELLALVERVARAHRPPPDELAEMKRLAVADQAAAWEAFTATAAVKDIR